MSHHPSVIARPDTTGFTGRQVHSAGPPPHITTLLKRLYHGPFGGDLDAMQTFLIDDHPGGWSQLGYDPMADTGWSNSHPFRDGFICYCHGDRHESYPPFTQDSDATFVDWLYVIGTDGIAVSRADWSGDDDFDDAPPTWEYLGCTSWGEEAAESRAALLDALRNNA